MVAFTTTTTTSVILCPMLQDNRLCCASCAARRTPPNINKHVTKRHRTQPFQAPVALCQARALALHAILAQIRVFVCCQNRAVKAARAVCRTTASRQTKQTGTCPLWQQAKLVWCFSDNSVTRPSAVVQLPASVFSARVLASWLAVAWALLMESRAVCTRAVSARKAGRSGLLAVALHWLNALRQLSCRAALQLTYYGLQSTRCRSCMCMLCS